MLPAVYKKGDLIEYHSSSHREWLPAVVINTNETGDIIIDLKPNTWISLEVQSTKVRPTQQESPAEPKVQGNRVREYLKPSTTRSAVEVPRSSKLGGPPGAESVASASAPGGGIADVTV